MCVLEVFELVFASGSLFAVFADQLGIVVYVCILSALGVVAGLYYLILWDDVVGIGYIGMAGCYAIALPCDIFAV